MKKKSIKKWILSLCSVMILSLVVGFSLPKMEAKALSADEYNIYDYSWANFFNIDNLDFNSTNTVRTLERVTSPLGHDGFKVTFKNSDNIGHALLDSDVFRSTGTLNSITEIGTYTVLYNVFDTNIVLNGSDFISLSFYFNSSSATEPWGKADYSGAQILVPNLTYQTVLFLDCFVSLENGQRRNMQAGEYVCFSEVRICFGQANWADYTPYFYSLETLPDIDDENGDSGNSGSGSGGSTTPDVPDVPDVPIVNGSYQEGYLAGLAQAQYGVFHNADFYLCITDDYDSYAYQIYPDFIANGVDFTTIYQNFRQNYPTLKQCFIFVTFPNPVPVSSLSLAATCHSSVFSISDTWSMAYNDATLDLKMKWTLDGKVNNTTGFATYQNSFDVTDYYCDIITFSPVSNMSAYNGFALYMSNDNYSAGYRDGQNSVSDDIYNDGYNTGHRIGYDSGYNKGSRDGNSWLGLFTAVIDAPVNVFSNLLNFDVLGFNMKNLFLSLLTVALAVAILRLFAKGDSTS